MVVLRNFVSRPVDACPPEANKNTIRDFPTPAAQFLTGGMCFDQLKEGVDALTEDIVSSISSVTEPTRSEPQRVNEKRYKLEKGTPVVKHLLRKTPVSVKDHYVSELKFINAKLRKIAGLLQAGSSGSGKAKHCAGVTLLA